MKKIAIITDSAAGIKDKEYQDVYVLPLVINVQDKKGKIISYHDQVDITANDLSKYLNSKEYEVKTSQSSYGEMARLIESIQDKYDRIYVLPISRTISSSINTWRMVAQDYPKLLVLDNTDVTVGLKWSVLDILQMSKKESITDQEVIDYIENIKDKRYGTLFVYDFKQLAKGGRVSNAKSMLAKFFNLKAIISADYKGLNFYKTTKSFMKGVDLAFDYCKSRTPSFDTSKVKRLGIVYSNKHIVDGDVELCADKIINILNNKNIQIETVEMPSTIVAHTGDKMFAFYMEEGD